MYNLANNFMEQSQETFQECVLALYSSYLKM